ncbi:dna mismatch repair-like protein [Nannochloropsis gaditana CCMP526]|uniref:dna mismatch repair-like protein n=1 Tax=Nannochloropsis gaditana (strain CCMP526) TaxID=1093141 RepID=UPI00029F7411|nr:dna mismatch repair-like protein [Nannochloropsis gaditana CCMP526]EKU22614.1 dna mismatch repair-like protein [Nannochloropsis gaditana CCMP526]|eukprot:XP_005853745.1 dna mismatch repair-like protein [Nannochloropsis gaditana CCMP526]
MTGGMTAILKKHIFVGVVDDVFSLIQHDTKLLLVRHVELCKELFYQLAVRRFACMPRLSLASNPVPLRSALRVALDLPEMEWKEGYGSKDEDRL